jgi:hypothetical protein
VSSAVTLARQHLKIGHIIGGEQPSHAPVRADSRLQPQVRSLTGVPIQLGDLARTAQESLPPDWGCPRVVVLDKLREGGARYDRSLNPSRAEDWRRLSLAKNTSFDRPLCCHAFITMMKASKLWDLDDSPSARYLPRKRTWFGEP